MRPNPIEPSEVDLLINVAMTSFPDANLDVVQNFCWNATSSPVINADNLNRESIQFQWNSDTINVIRHVLTTLKKL